MKLFRLYSEDKVKNVEKATSKELEALGLLKGPQLPDPPEDDEMNDEEFAKHKAKSSKEETRRIPRVR